MRYRFGDFVLDARAYTLTRAGREVALQPKVFDVLRYLLEHRERVVTKEELLDTLWRGEHVNEGAVPWSISHARRVLGQERGQKQPIETVHGRGYRFVSPVEQIAATEPPPTLPPPPAAPVSSSEPASATATARALPFVGRGEVMQQLEGWLARGARGEGGLCLLLGEAGIGKTRCAEELAQRARARGIPVWVGRAVEGLGAPVLWPWLQVLREAIRDRPALRPSGDELLSRLAALPQDRTGEAGTQRTDAADRFWVLDGVSRFLLDAVHQGQAVVLLDDLHWADTGTIELLTFLSPELRRSSLLVIATLRDELAEHERRRMNRVLREADRIELKRLSLTDVARYIAEITHGPDPDTDLCRAVHRASAGNPLFVQETVRALLADGPDKARRAITADDVRPSQLARDVLRASLRPLDDRGLRALSLASVLGETFELGLLQRLCTEPIGELLPALERAERSGLLIAEGPNRYRFAHALIRSILYDDLPSSERVITHRRVAELLEELSRGEPRASEIALHYHRSLPAGEYDRVTIAACRAAQAAERVQAFADAVSFYEWALEAQALDPQVTPRARAELLNAQAVAQRKAGRDESARRTLSTVIDIARQHGFADLLLGAARTLRPTHAMSLVPDERVREALEEVLKIAPQGPDPLRIGALGQLACIPPYALDLQQSGELSRKALSLARELGRPGSVVEALRARLYSLSGPSDIDALLEVVAEMLEHDRELRSWVATEAHVARYGALLYRGDLPAADATLREYGRITDERRMPEGIWFHDRLRAQRRLLDGELDTAEATIQELRDRSKRMGLSYGPAFTESQRTLLTIYRKGPEGLVKNWDLPVLFSASSGLQPSYRASLVRLAAETGPKDAAQRMLETLAIREFEDLPKDLGYLNALHHLSIAAVTIGDRAKAERLYALLSPYPHHNTPNTMMFYEGSTSFALALLAAALDRPEAARVHFQDALAMNERIGARPQLARVHLHHAQFLRDLGGADAQLAREHAERAAAIADQIGMPWLAERARAL